jgi:hypothetical protein
MSTLDRASSRGDAPRPPDVLPQQRAQHPAGDQGWRGCLRKLGPDDDAALRAATVSRSVVDQAVAAAGPEATGWAVQLSRRLHADFGGNQIFGYCHPMALPLMETVSLWTLLRLNGHETLPRLFAAELTDIIRTGIRASLPVDLMLECLRFAHAGLAQELFRFCATVVPTADQPAAMREVSEDLFDGMAVLISAIIRHFAVEHGGWLAGPAQDRVDLVNMILAARPVDLRQATRRLGYDLTLHHLALVLQSSEDSADASRELERTAQRVLDGAGCSSTLLLPVAPTRLWAWGGRASGRPTELRHLGEPSAIGANVRVASGLPGDGVAGFRRSHAQARTADQVGARTTPDFAGLHDYGELELLVLLGDDIGVAADFVARELGALARNDKPTAVLRETLLGYLELDRSVATTAERLYVAKNTVVYRVKKAEQLLGRSVREDRLRLHTALFLAVRLGSGVLAGGRSEAALGRTSGQRSA